LYLEKRVKAVNFKALIRSLKELLALLVILIFLNKPRLLIPKKTRRRPAIPKKIR